MISEIDSKITREVLSWPASWQPIFRFGSFVGEPLIVLSVSFLMFLTSIYEGSDALRDALGLGMLAYGFSIIIKFIIRRQRPHNYQLKTLGIASYSFPSGHAVGTVLFYGLFAWLAFKHLNQPLNLAVFIGSWIVIIIVGLSRVRLKYHYPSDVIIGWALGLVFLVSIIWYCF